MQLLSRCCAPRRPLAASRACAVAPSGRKLGGFTTQCFSVAPCVGHGGDTLSRFRVHSGSSSKSKLAKRLSWCEASTRNLLGEHTLGQRCSECGWCGTDSRQAQERANLPRTGGTARPSEVGGARLVDRDRSFFVPTRQSESPRRGSVDAPKG